MMRDLLTQKCAQKKVTDFWHVDSENIKFKIGPQTFLYQLFSKRDLNSDNVAKIGKIDQISKKIRLFSRFSGRGKH
jgi:hypothetical protein